MDMAEKSFLLLLLSPLCVVVIQYTHGITHSQWANLPPSWGRSDDPCGMNWDGVVCEKSRVTVVKLSSTGIKGTLSPDIGQLTGLWSLDLSLNNLFGGPLSPNIGNLKQLKTMILAGCSFSGSIPNELGNLYQLCFLALNSNKFSGTVPASLGGLSNLYLLDLSDNQLSGPSPISTKKAHGLDQLVNTKHFHFSKNKFSGNIPETLFSPNMSLIHLYLSDNTFEPSETPACFLELSSLTVLAEHQSLELHFCLSIPGFDGFPGSSVSRCDNCYIVQSLESSFWIKLGPSPGSVFLQNPMLDSDAYLELQVKLFPSDGIDFNRSEIIRIGFDLSNQIYQAPSMFGTYYFNGTPCPFPAWANNVNDKDGATQLKGARWFSYDELRKITNNFSEANANGSGGYGKVYRALLPSCQKVAIKRAQLGSMQGGLEFKAEIEMLSRVHHKNQIPIGFGRLVERAIRCVEETSARRPTMREVVKEIEEILHYNGPDTNTSSAPSSTTDFWNAKGAFYHLYDEPLPRKVGKGNAFDYSGRL
ncbi:hypothetical protein HPP92_006550 [Vanilla planifolia]|uniref:Uncharacterized protein n=1 Tax=Vanilla planifolia TaxID=51239 RepID=A0A835RW61_VANPL|nr:hypothetical protein HPP92_006550 [Vanilla planifolia]